MRVVRRIVIALLVLAGIGLLGVRWWIGSLEPSRSGRESIPGLGDSVTVLWDSLAVPHVIAHSDSDFFAVLGYLHARDRMWQMDLLRRLARSP